jgi:glycosyltransferase involved in cell wall biosynthesis
MEGIPTSPASSVHVGTPIESSTRGLVRSGRPRRRRLLLIAYYFPPANGIGGVRAFNIAKWLSREDWEVTVVTPAVEAWRNTENTETVERDLAREGIRCIRANHHWRILSPAHLACPDSWAWSLFGGVSRRVARLGGLEVEIGWMHEAERACAGLEPRDVDVILATGKPFGSFELARRLGERLRRPFVLDYRDLWTTNPHAISEPRASTIRIEDRLLEECAEAIAVSPGVAADLEARCPPGKRVHVVTNGYDPEELAQVQPFDFGHFAIVYAGLFYPPKRVISPVMAALRLLRDRRPGRQGDWAFHYYGGNSNHVRLAATQYGLSDRLVLHGLLPRARVLEAVKGAGLSVVVASVKESSSNRDRGIVTGKVFDAIGLGSPMLIVAPQGSDLEEIVRTAGRGARFSGGQADPMSSYLERVIEGKAPPAHRPEAYAWPNLVRELDSILDSARASGKPLLSVSQSEPEENSGTRPTSPQRRAEFLGMHPRRVSSRREPTDV